MIYDLRFTIYDLRFTIYDLRFTIYDSTNDPGVIVAGPLTTAATAVSNGLFTVTLDFGASVFTGANRWLEIGVRTNGGGAFSALSPRQPLTATPYAVFAGGANASGLIGTIPSTSIGAGTVTSNMLAPGSVTDLQLSPGAAAANLAAAHLGAVAAGGIVLAESANSNAMQSAGYIQLGGTISTPDRWLDGPSLPPSPPATTHLVFWTGTEMLVSGWSAGNPPVGGFYDPGSDTWRLLNTNGAPRSAQVGVWTGSELLVAGSFTDTNNQQQFTGARYHPGTGNWTPVSTTDAPQHYGTAVWTGSRMILWGGYVFGSVTVTNTGAAYNPTTDAWTLISTVDAPAGRSGHSAIWTGTRMLVWGGLDGTGTLASGGSYDPVTDTWASLSVADAPEARTGHTAIWTGARMIVWGGATNTTGFNLLDATVSTGGSYDPMANTWTAIADAGTDSARVGHSAVWNGSEMLVYGGSRYDTIDLFVFTVFFEQASRYHAGSNLWIYAESLVGTTSGYFQPFERYNHGAVWTGNEMLVWGGAGWPVRFDPSTGKRRDGYGAGLYDPIGHKAVWTGQEMITWGGKSAIGVASRRGFRFNPATSAWSRTSETNAPSHRQHHSVVWSGTELMVWGGYDENPTKPLKTGGRYNPVTGNWAPINTNGAPTARYDHTAIWTGTEMIIFGGEQPDDIFGGSFSSTVAGARYNPALDSWMPLTATNAPVVRSLHTAVWSGSAMIIWGGWNVVSNIGTSLSSGARYDPIANNWTALSLLDAPQGRRWHSAVWTGDQMLVWGGSEYSSPLDTGGSYSALSNKWTALPTLNAPSGRLDPTAIWTGSEMVIWGGNPGTLYGILNSGGVFNPVANTWTACTALNTPPARTSHTAVWSGSQMLVFGGEPGISSTPTRVHLYIPPRTLYLWMSQH